MKRRALLIEAAKVKGLDYLPGAEADIRNYQQYLCSIAGGCWQQTEIRTLSKPSRNQLQTEIRTAERDAEYLFISFSGHGYMKRYPNQFPRPTENQLTMLCLNDSEEIPVSDINPTIKNFLIADSCRGFEQVMEKAMVFAEALTDSARSTREEVARRLFDDAVRSAEAGQILAYSCGVNESAGDDANSGGYFSSAMMECGITLSSSGHQRAISTREVFDCAYHIVKSKAAQQNPQYSAGRRMRHFPFAVRS